VNPSGAETEEKPHPCKNRKDTGLSCASAPHDHGAIRKEMGSRSLTAIRKLRGWVRDDGRKSEERSLGFARDDTLKRKPQTKKKRQ